MLKAIVNSLFACWRQANESHQAEARDSLTDEHFNSIMRVSEKLKEERNLARDRPVSQVLQDIVEERVVKSAINKQGTSPFFQLPSQSSKHVSTCKNLCRTVSAGLSAVKSLPGLTINLERTATEPAILITTRSKRYKFRNLQKRKCR